MKKYRKTLIKSCITLFVLLSCIIFSLKTFSWFAIIKENKGSGIGAKVSEESDMEISDVLILKRNNKGEVINAAGEEIVSLSEYDPLMSGREFNTPLILITNIMLSSDGIGGYSNFYNTIKCDENSWKITTGSGLYLTDYISNVIELRSTFIDEIDINADTAEYASIYESCIDKLEDDSISNPQTFVKYTGSNSPYTIEDKENVVAFNYNNSDFAPFVNVDGQLTVIYEIDYSDVLINEFLRLKNEAGIESSTDRLKLNGDLSHILFKDGVYNG